MAPPRRPVFSPRRPGARPQGHANHDPEPGQGDDVNRALVALLPRIARMAPTPQPRPHVPASAAPEKCRLEMSAGEYRAWRHSMDWWLKLNKFSAADAVGHIRLSCSPELQRALDTRYTVTQWSLMSSHEALDSIKQLAIQPSNRAADWDKFFSCKQVASENISAFFTRSAQVVAECEFSCPRCNSDIGDYILLRKVIVGLNNPSLRKEVFRQCDTLLNMDLLRSFCVAYESAMKDLSTPVFGAAEAAAAADADASSANWLEQDGDVATAFSRHSRNGGGKLPTSCP